MSHHVYTLWASVKDEAYPWMIAAEDEFSWHSDPDRCEKVFQNARNLCDENGWRYREVTLLVNYSAVRKHFEPGSVEADVDPPSGVSV